MISIARLRAFVGLKESDASQDAFLVPAEVAAVDWFGRQTRRYWGVQATFTEFLSGDGVSQCLELANPAVSVPTVSYRSHGSSTWTDFAATDFEWEGDMLTDYLVAGGELPNPSDPMFGARLFRLGTYAPFWPGGVRNIRAVYTAGWSVNEGDDEYVVPPQDVRYAIGQIVGSWMRKRGTVRKVEGAGTDDDNLRDYPETLRATVDHYRRLPRLSWQATSIARA